MSRRWRGSLSVTFLFGWTLTNRTPTSSLCVSAAQCFTVEHTQTRAKPRAAMEVNPAQRAPSVSHRPQRVLGPRVPPPLPLPAWSASLFSPVFLPSSVSLRWPQGGGGALLQANLLFVSQYNLLCGKHHLTQGTVSCSPSVIFLTVQCQGIALLFSHVGGGDRGSLAGRVAVSCGRSPGWETWKLCPSGACWEGEALRGL